MRELAATNWIVAQSNLEDNFGQKPFMVALINNSANIAKVISVISHSGLDEMTFDENGRSLMFDCLVFFVFFVFVVFFPFPKCSFKFM